MKEECAIQRYRFKKVTLQTYLSPSTSSTHSLSLILSISIFFFLSPFLSPFLPLSLSKVMSYNIMYNNRDWKGTQSWDVRKRKTASILRFFEPDVVGLQGTHNKTPSHFSLSLRALLSPTSLFLASLSRFDVSHSLSSHLFLSLITFKYSLTSYGLTHFNFLSFLSLVRCKHSSIYPTPF